MQSHAHDARAIVTATNSFVTCPIAREFGIEHLIATEPEECRGEFTGRVPGVPASARARSPGWRSGWRSAGCRWESFTETWFYSDSLNDLPLLAKVTHPVAVDPDETLKESALEQGWMIISLR